MLYWGVKCCTRCNFPRNSTKTRWISLAYQQSVTVSHIRFLGISTKGFFFYFLAIPSRSLLIYFLSHMVIFNHICFLGISTKGAAMEFLGFPTKTVVMIFIGIPTKF